MNTEFVLKLLKPYLTNNTILELDFEKVFSMLNLSEKYSVIDILIEQDIDIVFEDDDNMEESQTPNIDNINKNSITKEIAGINYKNIDINNEQLCLMYQKGENMALDLLYIKNTGFIRKTVNKVSHGYKHKLDDEDLMSYGFMGLRKAALNFNPELENKFLTYAYYWIMQSITRAIADFGFTIRIPVHMFDLINTIRAVSNQIELESEKDLMDYICKNKEISEQKVKDAIIIANTILNPTSLNILVGEEQDSELIEFLPSYEDTVEQEVEKRLLREDLLDFMELLTDREADIIKLRFGFDTEVKTLEEIGKYYKVTRERIRQIEAKALRKLRSKKSIKELKTYLGEF